MGVGRRLLSQSGLIFGSRLFGAGLVFATQAAMARLWGAAVLGDYLLVIAAVNIAAVVLPLGFQTIGTYFAAEYAARGERQSLGAFMRRAYGHVLAMSAVLAAVIVPLAQVMGAPGAVLAAHWLPLVLMTFATAIVYCNSALLVGLRRPMAGFFADTLFRPLLIVVALLLATLMFDGAARLEGLLWLLASGFLVIAGLQFGWLWRRVGQVGDTAPARADEARRWWRFALPWVVIALATDFFFDIDLLILAIWFDRETLAVFGVMSRVFSIVAFAVSTVYAVGLPAMVAANVRADRPELLRQLGSANLAATGISLGLLAFVAAFGPLLLALFGPAFAAGAAPLAVLCLALAVRSLFGPAALVLSIHDRPWTSLPAVALGMAMLVGCNILFVPAHGLMGAAVAALVAQTFWSAAMWLTARRIAGVDVSVLPRLRELARSRIVQDI